MQVQFEFLSDRPEDVPLVIEWWQSVWADRIGPDGENVNEQLRASLSKQELPIHILATLHGKPIGIAALKLQELAELFPDKQYWLGSVFVVEEYRGYRFASALSQKIVEMARKQSLPHLYLQTLNLDGGLYAKLGWQPLQQFNYKDEEILLMVKQL